MADDPWPAEYQQPVIKEVPGEMGRRLRVEVLVFDAQAVNLNRDDLLGDPDDYETAAKRCNEAIERRYGAVIMPPGISGW